MKRTALKRGNKPIKRNQCSIVKKTPRKLAQEANEKEKTLLQNIMFLRIWRALRPEQRVCYETGERLYSDSNNNPLTTYFHHVLSKEVYPQFMLSPWNIVLVSQSTHNQYETFPQACPKIYALYLYYKSKLPTLEP